MSLFFPFANWKCIAW